mgnify:CR=1 FL=1
MRSSRSGSSGVAAQQTDAVGVVGEQHQLPCGHHAQREHRQIFPQPGWVEHDPREIWREGGVPGAVLGLGPWLVGMVACGVVAGRLGWLRWGLRGRGNDGGRHRQRRDRMG